MLRPTERFLLDYDGKDPRMKRVPMLADVRQWLRERVPVIIADGISSRDDLSPPKLPCMPPLDRQIVDTIQEIECAPVRALVWFDRISADPHVFRVKMAAYTAHNGKDEWHWLNEFHYVMFNAGGIMATWGWLRKISDDAKSIDEVLSLGMLNPPHGNARALMTTCLSVFEVCHCRNVSTDPVTRPESFGKLYRSRVRQREPSVLFRTITVTHRKKRYPITLDSAAHSADQMRLHIVRGHFARYTDAAPAFGRITGTFWIPSHARGGIEAGQIHKDYRVEQKG